MKRTLLMMVCNMAIVIYSQAVTVTWDGDAGTTNWTDALNWSMDAKIAWRLI